MAEYKTNNNSLDYYGKFEFDDAMSFYIYSILEAQSKEKKNQGSIVLAEVFETIETKRKRLNKPVLPVKIIIEF